MMRSTNYVHISRILVDIALKSVSEAIHSFVAPKITSNLETYESRENFR